MSNPMAHSQRSTSLPIGSLPLPPLAAEQTSLSGCSSSSVTAATAATGTATLCATKRRRLVLSRPPGVATPTLGSGGTVIVATVASLHQSPPPPPPPPLPPRSPRACVRVVDDSPSPPPPDDDEDIWMTVQPRRRRRLAGLAHSSSSSSSQKASAVGHGASSVARPAQSTLAASSGAASRAGGNAGGGSAATASSSSSATPNVRNRTIVQFWQEDRRQFYDQNKAKVNTNLRARPTPRPNLLRTNHDGSNSDHHPVRLWFRTTEARPLSPTAGAGAGARIWQFVPTDAKVLQEEKKRVTAARKANAAAAAAAAGGAAGGAPPKKRSRVSKPRKTQTRKPLLPRARHGVIRRHRPLTRAEQEAAARAKEITRRGKATLAKKREELGILRGRHVRLFPTKAQAEVLRRWIGVARASYNFALYEARARVAARQQWKQEQEDKKKRKETEKDKKEEEEDDDDAEDDYQYSVSAISLLTALQPRFNELAFMRAVPFKVRAHAVKDLCHGKKVATQQHGTTWAKMHYRQKKDDNSIVIPAESTKLATRDQLERAGFARGVDPAFFFKTFASYFGKGKEKWIRTAQPLSADWLRSDMRLVRHRKGRRHGHIDRFYLVAMVNTKLDSIPPLPAAVTDGGEDKRMAVLSMDAGSRAFQTYVGSNGEWGEYAPGDVSRLFRLAIHTDELLSRAARVGWDDPKPAKLSKAQRREMKTRAKEELKKDLDEHKAGVEEEVEAAAAATTSKNLKKGGPVDNRQKKHVWPPWESLCMAERKDRRRKKQQIRRRRRDMYRAAGAMQTKIRNLVTDVHRRVAKDVCSKAKIVLVSRFETAKMCERTNRLINTTAVRQLLGWSHYRFRQRLRAKAELMGTRVIEVGEAYTSKTCCNCGYYHKHLGGNKVFNCPRCNLVISRDLNGAINILNRNSAPGPTAAISLVFDFDSFYLAQLLAQQ